VSPRRAPPRSHISRVSRRNVRNVETHHLVLGHLSAGRRRSLQSTRRTASDPASAGVLHVLTRASPNALCVALHVAARGAGDVRIAAPLGAAPPTRSVIVRRPCCCVVISHERHCHHFVRIHAHCQYGLTFFSSGLPQKHSCHRTFYGVHSRNACAPQAWLQS